MENLNMNNNDLMQLKKEYLNTPIPDELDFVVNKALKESKKNMKKTKNLKRICTIAASITIVTGALTFGINSSPVFARALAEVPIVGKIVNVLTFKEYTVKEDTFDANIKVPAIDGLDDKNLENSLNKKYLAENKELYDQFMVDMKELKENGGGHLGVDSGYIIKTDTEDILSIGRYVVNIVGSSSTTFKYDTIDKKNEVLITLPSLFKDDSYIDIISKNIKEQMIAQNKADENKIYWVEGIERDASFYLFDKISEEQNFYITEEGKLVISFNKYDVAPGYMGVVEFEIPTEIIYDILASNEYIK